MTATLAAFDPAAPEVIADPYPHYARYRQDDPVHWGVSALAGYPGAWYAFRHADTATVLRDPRFGKARRAARPDAPAAVPPDASAAVPPDAPAAARPAAPAIPAAALPYFAMGRQWIAHRDPPDHTRLRDVLWPHFTAGAVERMRPTITRVTDHLIDRLPRGRAADLVAGYAAVLPFQVIGGLLGVPEPDWPRLVEWSAPMREVGVRTSERTWQSASDAVTGFGDYFSDLVARRRREPAADLLTALVAARDAGQFADDGELVAQLVFLVYAAAGLHTTTALVATGVHLLLSHPDQRALLASDPDLISGAVHEFLRLEPPLQITNRTAAADVSLGARRIAAGDSVLAVLASANRDPAVHEHPDRLDITRRRRPHQTFSAGTHTCFGGPLATVEGEIGIGRLLRRFPDLAPAGEAEWAATGSLRMLTRLPVEVR